MDAEERAAADRAEPVPDWMREHVDGHLAVSGAVAGILPAVTRVAVVIRDAFSRGNRLYTFGNGGSAADAQHLSGELIGRYRARRRPLPAVTLGTDSSVLSCIGNDFAFDDVFARQVEALATPGDVVAAFTTTGRSPNVVNALAAARLAGATTVLFGGGSGGAASALADHELLVRSADTPRVQEAHTLMLHMISEFLDSWAAGQERSA
ncbi:MAG TPA: SIS domain-containing protein [Trebonia sp.]|nr:SIS domain-containing protein [Trebonia sp.]